MKQKQTNLSAISSRPLKSQLLLVIKILNAKFHEELHDLDLLTYLALSERTKEAGANNKKIKNLSALSSRPFYSQFMRLIQI